MTTIEAQIEDKNKRLDVFLAQKLGVSRNIALKIIKNGVTIENSLVDKSSFKLKGTEKITFDDQSEEEKTIKPQNIALDIRYEDEDLLVINKQKGLLCHPTAYNLENTLVNALLWHCGDNLSNKNEPNRRGIVHRLDKNTAGLMLAAKTDFAMTSLQEQIKNKSAIRKYKAIVLGTVEKDFGAIDKPLVHYMTQTVKMKVVEENEDIKDKKPAITNYKVLERFEGATLLELELKTGRTHQIRAHMAHIGHPVFGDSLYGAKGKTIEKYRNIKTTEQILQSYYLSFKHPTRGDIMNFELKEDEFSPDFKKVLNIMRENL